MSPLDYAVIALYFAVMLGVGVVFQRLASRNLDAYFLGGKSMNWLAMSMSGAVSNFDISGTMWIVTLLYLFGMKSMWNHWMWGFLMGAFFMSFMGKWVRRSGVMTGAEWMVTRFGDGPGGRAARMAYALMAVVTLTAFTAYAFRGIGTFASETLAADIVRAGVDLHTAGTALALAVFAVTTVYTLLGGLYSVVVTNVIQTAILSVAAVVIAAVAYVKVTPELLAATLPDGWASLAPVWQVEITPQMQASGYGGYHLFGALVMFWVVKGLLLNLGGPGQMYDFQVFLAARSPRDAAKIGAAWSGFLVVRWAMCMGIALLAVAGLVEMQEPAHTPQAVEATADAADGRLSLRESSATPAERKATPAERKAALAPGEFNAERVMPAVLRDHLGPGVRGLVLAGLLAAFMSTFAATVNSAASYVVRDLYQPLARLPGDSRALVRAGYAATLGVVMVGTLVGLAVKSVGEIFTWIMMVLGAAFVIPNVLRWYWWRLNGWGYAVGTLAGLGLAFVLLLPRLVPAWTHLVPPDHLSFLAVCAVSLPGCLAATWLTRPTDGAVLGAFYATVRPFGFWGPVARRTPQASGRARDAAEGPALAALNVVLACVAILGAYLAPMYLVGHFHAQAGAWFAAAAAACAALYFTWYKTLPAE